MTDPWGLSSPDLTYLTSKGIPSDRARAWLEEISSLRLECGCKLGTIFFLGSILLFVAAAIFVVEPTFAFAGVAFLLPCLALPLGKWLGKYLAHRRMLERIAAMRAELQCSDAEGDYR